MIKSKKNKRNDSFSLCVVLQMALLESSLKRLESMSVLIVADRIYSTVYCHYLVVKSQSVFERVRSVPCDKMGVTC